jgi:integrase
MKFLELAEQVLEQRDRDGIRGWDREMSRFRCHVQPAAFAQKDVTEIKPRDVREWLREMAQKDAARPGPKRKLSQPTIDRSKSLVSVVFDEAVEREIIEINPCLGVKSKKRVGEGDTVEKWAYLTADEQDAIAGCEVIPRPERLMIAFAAHTGLRQGEWRHLHLDDLILDGDNPRVIVRVASRARRTKELLPPKSGKRREVPLLPPALAAAREWVALLPTYAPENPQRLVFPTARGGFRQQGKPFGRSNTLKQYYVAAGIKLRPYLHFHALRHTFATNLVSGVYGRSWSLEEIRVVMGHSSITITQRYAHLGDSAIKRAVRETVAASTATAPAAPSPPPEPAPLAIVVRVPEEARPARSLLSSVIGRFTRVLGGSHERAAH